MSIGSGVVGGAGVVAVSMNAELNVTWAVFKMDGRLVGTLKFLTAYNSCKYKFSQNLTYANKITFRSRVWMSERDFVMFRQLYRVTRLLESYIRLQ